MHWLIFYSTDVNNFFYTIYSIQWLKLSKRQTQRRLTTKGKKAKFILNETKSNESIVQVIGDQLFVKMVIMNYAASSKRNKSEFLVSSYLYTG